MTMSDFFLVSMESISLSMPKAFATHFKRYCH